MRKLSSTLIFTCLTSLLLAPAAAREVRSDVHDFRMVQVTGGLEHPWGLAFLPDGGYLVTERPGRLRRVDAAGNLDPEPVGGLPAPIATRGQGGLLDVALHPDFPENGLVYISYSGAANDGLGTEVARGRLAGNRLHDVETLFRMQPKSGTTRHFGSRLVFSGDGTLYVTLGDRGEMNRAQITDDHAGSIVRINDDGTVPADNPFVGRDGYLPEIYTIGNRNVQGAALHPETGELWTHEHGPQGGDEVNRILPGANYGWPVITYGVNYGSGTPISEHTAMEGMEQPLWYWVPVSIAPSGMAFYTGEHFPRWQGSLFVGALRGQMLVRLALDGNRVVSEERMLEDVLGRIRDVRQGPDGYLYLLNDAADGVLVRLEPPGGTGR